MRGYKIEWAKEDISLDAQKEQLKFLSIVIVARNEGDQLLQCVNSILTGNYPDSKFEIIVVDDHSEDDSFAKLISLNDNRVRILKLADASNLSASSFKKQGQAYGIAHARADWIVTTDGDCICPPHWLEMLNQSTDTFELVTGPIQMVGDNSWLSEFQQFDTMGTMAGTNFGIVKYLWRSANAANMIFLKSLYENYQQQFNTSHASGDDMFLIQWAAEDARSVGFICHPRAMVKTTVESDFYSFWQQRIRWASKSKNYKEKGLIKLMAGIWLFNISILLNCALAIGYDSSFWKLVLLQIVVKYFSELQLFKFLGDFFQKQISSSKTLILSILHILYVTVIGIATPFIQTYNWKGRKER